MTRHKSADTKPSLKKKERSEAKNPPSTQPNYPDNTHTTISKPELMEAYHPHGKKHGKKLKDLLFEFIMMFIAITAGFFMENMREHRTERQKESDYIVRLIRDIRQDTANISQIIKNNENQMKGLDTLSALIENQEEAIHPEKLIYQCSKYLNVYKGFSPRDITFSQLKNSGGLRLIENNEVADKIVAYYSDIEYRREINVKLNYRFMEESFRLEIKYIDFNHQKISNSIKSSDYNWITELGNRSTVFKSQINWDNTWLQEIKNESESLIDFLKKEYQIQD